MLCSHSVEECVLHGAAYHRLLFLMTCNAHDYKGLQAQNSLVNSTIKLDLADLFSGYGV